MVEARMVWFRQYGGSSIYIFETMLLQDNQTNTLIEVLDINDLINPAKDSVPGRIQEGQEEQDPESFAKQNLVFPSGETLPRCWQDADYQLK